MARLICMQTTVSSCSAMSRNQVIVHRRFTNDLPEILAPLAPYQAEIQGVVV